MNLYTIGYQGLTLHRFIRRLLANKVDLVADVRLSPISRKVGFSKSALSRELAVHGVAYVHYRQLGSPKILRNYLHETGDFQGFVSEYKMLLKKQLNTIEELYKHVGLQNVALMCFERDPQECHRSIIADEIKSLAGNQLKVHAI